MVRASHSVTSCGASKWSSIRTPAKLSLTHSIRSINVEVAIGSQPSSMSSSSVIQMPSAAPQDETPSEPLEQQYEVPHDFPPEIRSPGTLMSSFETPTMSSVTELSEGDESDWEDARGVRVPPRPVLNEFVFVDEDAVDADAH